MATDRAYSKMLHDDDSAQKALRRSGYASGGAIDQGDREAVRKHEQHLHRGEPETKLARGGHAPSRGGARTKVVVNAEGDPAAKQAAMQQGMQAGRQQGMQIGARLAAQKMAGAGARPPMPPGAGPGGPPPPGMPAPATMGAKRGGKIGKRE